MVLHARASPVVLISGGVLIKPRNPSLLQLCSPNTTAEGTKCIRSRGTDEDPSHPSFYRDLMLLLVVDRRIHLPSSPRVVGNRPSRCSLRSSLFLGHQPAQKGNSTAGTRDTFRGPSSLLKFCFSILYIILHKQVADNHGESITSAHGSDDVNNEIPSGHAADQVTKQIHVIR
ncbi:hypothetical protein BHE74_00026160 [Ensete ventricosum]|nr:hypothetical protein BHE74_00026160 [Ensete ventricosum]